MSCTRVCMTQMSTHPRKPKAGVAHQEQQEAGPSRVSTSRRRSGPHRQGVFSLPLQADRRPAAVGSPQAACAAAAVAVAAAVAAAAQQHRVVVAVAAARTGLKSHGGGTCCFRALRATPLSSAFQGVVLPGILEALGVLQKPGAARASDQRGLGLMGRQCGARRTGAGATHAVRGRGRAPSCWTVPHQASAPAISRWTYAARVAMR